MLEISRAVLECEEGAWGILWPNFLLTIMNICILLSSKYKRLLVLTSKITDKMLIRVTLNCATSYSKHDVIKTLWEWGHGSTHS